MIKMGQMSSFYKEILSNFVWFNHHYNHKIMRVFLTGATGFIGSAIVKELIQAGHQVLGLARSEASSNALIAAGAEVHAGSLNDLDSLKSAAASVDGVIHAGFIHDFTDYVAACETDRLAIAAMGSVLEGTGKPLIVTSGIGLLNPGNVGTEADEVASDNAAIPRGKSEEVLLSFAEKGVRAAIVRLPPSVHGDDDHGFVPVLINIAREKGVAAYIGDGSNHWPAVHRLDAARLFRLALEKGKAGAKYHGVADTGIPMKEIAEVIGAKLRLPVVSKTAEEAGVHFGWIGHFAGLDCPATSEFTKEQLGWTPVEKGLISDLQEGTYF
ncbi:3-beta hydroxysteroid dehydrogenase/isomerase [Pedobacter sp. BAL39]|nr:3-beta hydroxysteroid dehydrogenase/isomerase [Pedobacter sp. BAL39]